MAPSDSPHASPAKSPVDSRSQPITVAVPGTTTALLMHPLTSGVFVATTEVTWDMYDAFVFALDRGKDETDPPDAWARPSKPYILMDRGFGHAGYPAISVSFRGATEFCRWLSAKTQRRFRLPTEAEWMLACKLGSEGAANLDERAWCAENSEVEMRLVTHPVASKHADALGLFDLLGNAAEWTIGADGTGIARGGSFKDHAANLSSTTRRADDRKLNATDPQIPKSVWWLADGGFVGFRVVLESSNPGAEHARATPPSSVFPH